MLDKFMGLFGKKPATETELPEPAVPVAEPEVEELKPNEVLFTLCMGSTIPRRVFTTTELMTLLGNAETVWQHCIQSRPLLLAMLELSVDDMFLRKRMEDALKAIYDDDHRANDYEGCVRGYLKMCLVMLCVYTSTEVAYRFLKRDAHGTFNGILGTTYAILNMQNEPIRFDIQMSYITNTVWAIGHTQSPMRTTHSAIQTLNLFEMENDADMCEILNRVNMINAQAQIRYVS